MRRDFFSDSSFEVCDILWAHSLYHCILSAVCSHSDVSQDEGFVLARWNICHEVLHHFYRLHVYSTSSSFVMNCTKSKLILVTLATCDFFFLACMQLFRARFDALVRNWWRQIVTNEMLSLAMFQNDKTLRFWIKFLAFETSRWQNLNFLEACYNLFFRVKSYFLIFFEKIEIEFSAFDTSH